MTTKFHVCIVESRDLVFEVEAKDADEAYYIADEMDTPDAVRDSFRERTREWVVSEVYEYRIGRIGDMGVNWEPWRRGPAPAVRGPWALETRRVLEQVK